MFEDILLLKRKINFSPYEILIIQKVIDLAMKDVGEGGIGLRLAAAFDLLASFEYYNSVANKGWIYCSDNNQMIFYPYTNICPRCIGNGKFVYAKCNKLESGQIGLLMLELLCQILDYIFNKKGLNVHVYKAS